MQHNAAAPAKARQDSGVVRGETVFVKPKIKSSIDVHTLKGQFLFLLDEHKSGIMNAKPYVQLAPLLDGKHSLSEIADALSSSVSLPQIYFCLNELQKRGFIVEGDESHDGSSAPFYEYFNGETSRVTSRLNDLTITVQAVGPLSPALMIAALRDNGLHVAERGDFLVVVTDDYLRPELAPINRSMLEQNRPWMLVKPVGMIPWIGPVFQPGRTGCWECLAQRLKTNRQMERYIHDRKSGREPVVTSRSYLPATQELSCDLAVVELLKWVIGPDTTRLSGKLVTLDLFWRKSQEHVLVKRPQCVACGEQLRKEPSPVVLTSRKKEFREDGGHRTLTPEQTFQRFKHHISPILGAVSELVPALGNKSELTPSYVAGHNFSMGLDSIVFLKESLRGVSGGKGSTDIQAKVSGLCEAIERYSGIYCGDEHTIRGSYTALKPEAIHPNTCMGFSEEQYRQRMEWNASHDGSRYVLVPRPFDEEREIDWTPVWSLTHEQFRYLPTAYCYYGHPEFARQGWCISDSNGTAAGNTLEEALLQGFMELVERDAVALWWYNRIRRRALDLDSFELPYVDSIREYYASLNRELWVLDITSDLEIPTFVCVSRATDRPVENIIIGFGAHFDPKIALLRSITEVNQFLPSVSLLNPDGSTRYLFGDQLAKHWWTTAALAEHPYLKPLEKPPVKYSDIEDRSSDDLLTDIETCTAIARKHSLDFLVLDQTRPDIGLNVVKVIIPQVCHFWRRLGKARLYETPVRQGWLERPLKPEEINPFSIFF